jgi:anti-anti-sigma regulatory factor
MRNDPVPGPDSASPPNLEVAISDDGWQVIAYLHGEVGLATAEQLSEAIAPHLGPRQRVVLDLSSVTSLDARCLGALEFARAAQEAAGGSLTMRNPSLATGGEMVEFVAIRAADIRRS